jgi:dihydroorotate dehydrogenase electron transfer subunit
MTINNLSKDILKNIKGKIAIVSDECDLTSILYTIKSIKDSEIDLFAKMSCNVLMINDIKDFNNSLNSSQNVLYKGNLTEVFSPFEYNAVICLGDSSTITTIVNTCKTYATPVICLDNEIKSAKTA